MLWVHLLKKDHRGRGYQLTSPWWSTEPLTLLEVPKPHGARGNQNPRAWWGSTHKTHPEIQVNSLPDFTVIYNIKQRQEFLLSPMAPARAP